MKYFCAPNILQKNFLFYAIRQWNLFIVTVQSACQDAEVRLWGGTSNDSGYMQIKQDGTWHTVCSFGWNHARGTVFCHQLGYDFFAGFGIAKLAHLPQNLSSLETKYLTYATCQGDLSSFLLNMS